MRTCAPDGHVRGIITTAVETTEQKRREQTLRVLLSEVSHRSRNLLAIIQSIAMQTGRYSSTIEVSSRASAAGCSRWRRRRISSPRPTGAAPISATSCWNRSHATARRRDAAVRLEGERPWLNPNAALHVGLALHELVANSVSYGALSRPGRAPSPSSAQLEPDTAGQASLSLTWHETDRTVRTETVEPAVREKRFGSVALERIVPASLNGSASLKIEDGLLEYRLVIPFGNFETVED